MRKLTKKEADDRKTKKDVDPGAARPSEVAMQNAEASAHALPAPAKEKKLAEGRKRLRDEAEKVAAETGKSTEEVVRSLEAEWAGKPYKVEKRSIPGGNFFEVEYFGGTKRLWLNTESRFYSDLYAAPGTTPAHRFAMEVLLFSIGECILDARDEFRTVYDVELPMWSRKLEYALAQLARDVDSGSTGEDGQEDPSPIR
jgi:hypothetical protein